MRSPFGSQIWRNGAFVRVWTAATISIFGSLITRMALPFVAILLLDAGALEVALVRTVDLGAALVFGLVAGAWVDRLRRRPVLIWADLGRAALLTSIPIAYLGGWLSLLQLVVVAFSAAILSTFFDAADNAYLPTIIERDRLVEANSALAASGSAAEFTGFGISGFLIQVLSAPLAIFIDALSFVVSAVLLASIRSPEAPPPPRADREPVLQEIRVGLSLVARDPVLRAFALAQMALAGLWGVFGGLWILFAVDELGLGPAAIGIIAGVGGAASFIGAVVAGRVTRRFGIGPVAIAAMLIAAVGNVLVPLAPTGAPVVAAVCLVGQQLVGDSAVTVYGITEVSVRQALVDDRQLGRVVSVSIVGAGFVQLVAALGAGLLAEVVGLRPALFLAPLGAIAGAVFLWASPVRSLATLPDGKAIGPVDPAAVVADRVRDEPIGG